MTRREKVLAVLQNMIKNKRTQCKYGSYLIEVARERRQIQEGEQPDRAASSFDENAPI
jgi:hypothetical protein